MSGLLSSELPTPALCVNLPALLRWCDLSAGRVQAAGKLWRPPADVHLLPEWSRLQQRAGACGVSLDSLSDAAAFAGSGLHDLFLTQPPIGNDLLPQFLKTFSQVALTVSCDHYAQAEDLSATACALGREISILIEVNVGRNQFGVRPGLDSRDLARGISRLQGVVVRGLSANSGYFSDSERAARQSSSALGILEDAKASLLRDGLRCDVISLAAEGVLQPVLTSSLVTEIRTGDPFSGGDASSDTSVSRFPLVAMVATVFSRPKLERAVLDAGRSHLGARVEGLVVRATATGRPLPDVRIESIDWNALTLDLGPLSRDLVIGDRVVLGLSDPRDVLRMFNSVHLLNEELVDEVWSSARNASSSRSLWSSP